VCVGACACVCVSARTFVPTHFEAVMSAVRPLHSVVAATRPRAVATRPGVVVTRSVMLQHGLLQHGPLVLQPVRYVATRSGAVATFRTALQPQQLPCALPQARRV